MSLTTEDKNNLDLIFIDKERDLEYRSWTRRVTHRVRGFRGSNEQLNHDAKRVIMCLKDLEGIYTARIMSVSIRRLVVKYEESYYAIAKTQQRKNYGVYVNMSDYLGAKL